MSTRGWEHATPADVRDRRVPVKPSKYRNVKTVVGTQTFDSAKEAKRYQELKLMEKAGHIRDVECQPVYELHAPNGEVLGRYLPDFRYRTSAGLIVEDVKGMKTLALARWKQKHLRAEYAVEVVEIR